MFNQHLKEALGLVPITEKLMTLSSMTDDDFKNIKKIERKSYPRHMRSYDDMDSMDIEGMLDYAETSNPHNVKIYLDDNKKWYLLFIEHPETKTLDIADMAGKNVGTAFYFILRKYEDWNITGSFRDSTSFKFIKMLLDRGKIDILSHDEEDWDGELMHDITFRFVNSKKPVLTESDYETLFEDITSNLGQSAAILRGDNKSKEAKEQAKKQVEILSQITQPYVDLPPKEGGEHAHLPMLVKWIKDGNDPERVRREYQSYMNLPYEYTKSKINMKLQSFDKFSELIHQIKSSMIVNKEEPTTENKTLINHLQDKEVKDSIVYKDDNVVVFWAKTHPISRKLSCGTDEYGEEGKFGLCIGWKDPSYYLEYLLTQNQTTYFVYFRNKESKKINYNGDVKIHTSPFIILDISKSGNVLWNTVTSLKDGNVSNKDEKTSINKMISVFPSISGFLESSEFKWREPSEEIIHTIAQDSDYAYLYAQDKNFKNIPDIIIQGIAQDINFKGTIEQAIAKDPRYAYGYAQAKNFENVPDIIIQGIAQDINFKGTIEQAIAQNSDYAYEYAEAKNFQTVPDIILQGIAKKPDYAYYYAQAKNFENIPDIIIQGIAKNPNFKGTIEQAIAQNSDYAYEYAQAKKFENIPDIIIQGIAKDPNFKGTIEQAIAQDSRYTYRYAKAKKFENVPDIILQGIAKDPNFKGTIEQAIAKDPRYAYGYAQAKKFEKVPDIIIQGIAQDSTYAYLYAKAKNFEEVPDIIIQGNAQNSYDAYNYAQAKNFQNVPYIILQGIAKKSSNAYNYAKAKNFEKVPQIIYDALPKDKKKEVKSIEKTNINESIKSKIHSILNEEIIIESKKPKKKTSKFGTYTKNGRTYFGWYPGTQTGGQEFNSDTTSEGSSDA